MAKKRLPLQRNSSPLTKQPENKSKQAPESSACLIKRVEQYTTIQVNLIPLN